MANQMFKDAFLVKKTRFSHLHPEFSDEQLHKMTIEYFRNLRDDEGKRGQIWLKHQVRLKCFVM